jgi:hypothetical protein
MLIYQIMSQYRPMPDIFHECLIKSLSTFLLSINDLRSLIFSLSIPLPLSRVGKLYQLGSSS